ncbi:hypothetical protein DICPUDRAFT_149694 [Dictyostelium purpureum]|uniref:Uncharacterized protein n=1 Tax=Dictyostelium purpureum TaxID=5786 RepID=F0ZEF4_DICPU|nr:uncharacterized protein DICPUDRAFT_149694 [Dictyostelium purpureum]EGC37684.1 hypothetical protein DICPUDRAFT_149694 [Dictyostelium purpureum]|eukprot:XP_003285788.1 hypothetical protein DICPUDRAFT_149694 [Dictyostelium purpureum]
MKYNKIYLLHLIISMVFCYLIPFAFASLNEGPTNPATISSTTTPLNCTEIICEKISKCSFPHIIIKDPSNPCCLLCF